MKNAMLYLIGVLVIVVLVLQIISIFYIAGLSSHIQQSNKTNTNNNTTVVSGKLKYISITASGSASAAPTIGMLNVLVTGKGKTAAAATANLSSELTSLNQSVYKYLNGNILNMKTTYYNLYNQSSYYYKTYNGFVAEEYISITIPQAQNLSNAIGDISTLNNITISGESATLSDSQITQLRSAAYSNALHNATSQAKLLSGNASLTISNITVNYNNYYPILLGTASTSSAQTAGSTATPAIYTSTTSVTQSITVVFSYQ